jgi:anaerobic magnesium-protoporphyrin IX monomethyl ester cyclase
MKGSVALVYPYFLTEADKHLLFQPLGIASLAAQLGQAGIEAHQCDCTFSHLDGIVAAIAAEAPDIVGVYAMVSMSRNAFMLVERLKERLPGALYVAGGPLPTLYPRRFAEHFDCVFRGEADLTFARFCADYLAGMTRRDFRERMALEKFPGIYLETKRGPVSAEPVNHPAHVLDSLPMPDRRGVDYRRYQEVWKRETGSTPATIMLTRGCPFACDFCSKPVFGSKFRKRSMDNVMEEVCQIASMGYDRLWIGDDSFTLDLGYLEQFCRAMIGRDAGMTWTCLSRASGVDGRIAAAMKAAGCVRVYLGLESGSDETLRLMKKKTTVGDGERTVDTFENAGVATAGFFMVGYPGEKPENMEKTFELALRLPLEEISFTVPYPLPGSELFRRVSGLHGEDDWEIENEVKFLFKTEFDQAVIKQRINETMAAFRGRRATAARRESEPIT